MLQIVLGGKEFRGKFDHQGKGRQHLSIPGLFRPPKLTLGASDGLHRDSSNVVVVVVFGRRRYRGKFFDVDHLVGSVAGRIRRRLLFRREFLFGGLRYELCQVLQVSVCLDGPFSPLEIELAFLQ